MIRMIYIPSLNPSKIRLSILSEDSQPLTFLFDALSQRHIPFIILALSYIKKRFIINLIIKFMLLLYKIDANIFKFSLLIVKQRTFYRQLLIHHTRIGHQSIMITTVPIKQLTNDVL